MRHLLLETMDITLLSLGREVRAFVVVDSKSDVVAHRQQVEGRGHSWKVEGSAIETHWCHSSHGSSDLSLCPVSCGCRIADSTVPGNACMTVWLRVLLETSAVRATESGVMMELMWRTVWEDVVTVYDCLEAIQGPALLVQALHEQAMRRG